MAGVYSVGQVNNYIKNMFNSDFVLNRLNVKGEVSNCKYHSSGHIYFTLKEQDNVLMAVMFAKDRTGLDFRLENGMEVVVTGSISVYERDGKYQLYARKIQQSGNGPLYEKFLEIKKELEEMGMFSPMYKQPIPKYIKILGVVTASTGAAVKDIINVATRRNPYIQIVLYPSQVQGEKAAESICRGIKTLDEYGVDTIIAGRGGGSIEDLWAFNERCVAETIFECKTPVISAVGHETDFTIADFVADMRAPTPSAAAELAVDDMNRFYENLRNYRSRLNNLMAMSVADYRRKTENLTLRMDMYSPVNVLKTRKQTLEDLRSMLEEGMNTLIADRKHSLSLLCARLEGNSPLARLKMGYAYVTDTKGRPVKSVNDVSVDDKMTVNVTDGKIYVKVIDKA